MESKICSYTEKHHRLQLVRYLEPCSYDLEIRYNRKKIAQFSSKTPNGATIARMSFVHAVNEICVNRSITMLNITV